MSRIPVWVSMLPPQLPLSPSQVAALEEVRATLGVPQEEFALHIHSHPETTKATQRVVFEQLRRGTPSATDEELLVQLLYTRYVMAAQAGQDLFGVHRQFLPNPRQPSPDFIAALIHVVRSYNWRTVDDFADALVIEEEADMPGDVPTHPSAVGAANEITRILRGDPTRSRV